jgi:hypothetical protein
MRYCINFDAHKLIKARETLFRIVLRLILCTATYQHVKIVPDIVPSLPAISAVLGYRTVPIVLSYSGVR